MLEALLEEAMRHAVSLTELIERLALEMLLTVRKRCLASESSDSLMKAASIQNQELYSSHLTGKQFPPRQVQYNRMQVGR